MPYKLKDPVRHKFEKKHYNKRDWKTYEEGLRNRGSLTIWFAEDAVVAWKPLVGQKKKKGGQRRFSDFAIETAHTLRLVYKQGFRQTEGMLGSIMKMMQLDLKAPDHTTLSRRAKTVSLRKKSCKEPSSKEDSPKDESISEKCPITVIIDSTGLKVVEEKEWMPTAHTCNG